MKLSTSCFIFTFASNSTDMQLKKHITTKCRLQKSKTMVYYINIVRDGARKLTSC